MQAALPIDVHRLLAARQVESLRIEYKAGWNHQTGGAALQTICAFANDLANVNGGYLVIGVREEGGAPILPPDGIPADEVEATQRAINGQIRRIDPAYHPTTHPVQVDDRWVIVIHCPAGDARPYACPESLAKAVPHRRYVRVGAETREAVGALERQLLEVSARVPFDDRACFDARPDDLSPDLLWHHLREAGSRMGERRVDARTAYRQLRLLRGTNGHEVPRNVAVLFFTEEPRRWIPGVAIEVAQFPTGKGGREIVERAFAGPLPGMLRAALDYLRGLLPVKVVKHGDRAEADRIEAWPFAAVEEALVNAVHHRGYDVPDPIKVEVLPDSLRVTSYPGPVPGLTEEALATGEIGALPARNRRIAELLREVNLAEARGTGLARIREALAENGSPAPLFRFDEERTYFEVVLPIHPAFRAVSDSGLPIRVGRPAPPDEVVGRDELVEELLRSLEHGPVLLVGPPGRGKTSLLGLVEARTTGRCLRLDLAGQTWEGVLAALVEWRERLGSAPVGISRLSAYLDGNGVLTPDDLALVFDAPTTVLLESVGVWVASGEHRRSLRFLLAGFTASDLGPRILGVTDRAPEFDDSSGLDPLRKFRVAVVPPLSGGATHTLARRLLRGMGASPGTEVADAVVTLSAGLPTLVHALAREIHVRRLQSEAEVDLAFDELYMDPADPTGLRERVRSCRERMGIIRLLGRRGKNGLRAELQLLSLVAAIPEGVRRLDLVGRAVSGGLPRLRVVEALRGLELAGWLVEVDGVVRFEHPLLRQEWLGEQESPTSPPPTP